MQVGTILKTTSYIAIDDVSANGDCSHPSNQIDPTAQPGVSTTIDPTMFSCKSGKHISNEKLCDWVKDCELGEDEKNCGTCNFANHDMCGYSEYRCKQ